VAQPPERDPFWGYSDVFLFAGLAIPCMLLGWAAVQGTLRLFHIHLAVRAAELLAEQLAGYLLLFSALRLIFRVQYGRPFWRSLAWTPLRVPFLWLVIAGFATAVSVAFSTYFIRVPTTSNPMTELLRDRVSILLLATFGVTLGPLCEELVFRGLLQPLLVRSLGPIPGILAAAIPFGLLHIPEYGNSWRHGVVIALAGAAFGWMRYSTGSTKASTVMHASYNALFFFVLLSQGKDLPHT
jgi:membrane protease YdiL (CAAX protease family)